MWQHYSCPSCGNLITPDKRFCTRCGTPLDWRFLQAVPVPPRHAAETWYRSRGYHSPRKNTAVRTAGIMLALFFIACAVTGAGFATGWRFFNPLQEENPGNPGQQVAITTAPAATTERPSMAPQLPSPAPDAPGKDSQPATTTPAATVPPTTAPGVQVFRFPASAPAPATTPALPATQSPVPALTGPPPPNSPSYRKPELNIADLEIQVHNLVNAERQKNGLPPLALDANLSNVARKHSADMAKRNYFDHVTPEGYNPGDRYRQSSYAIRTGWAENIFKCPVAKTLWYRNGVLAMTEYNQANEIAVIVVKGWMDSAGHRANILTTSLTVQGIGIAISTDENIYITEDFA